MVRKHRVKAGEKRLDGHAGQAISLTPPPLLKATVLAARSTYIDPAIPNTSGAIAGAALAKLGILDEVKDKTRHAALAVGGEPSSFVVLPFHGSGAPELLMELRAR
jgi:hypothetical protein